MNWSPLEPGLVREAIRVYVRLAYEGSPPAAVRARLEAISVCSEDAFYAINSFERTPDDVPTKFSLRLGNRFYPHMKFVIERAPDGKGTILRADTHDRHIQLKEGSPEAEAFAELQRKNQSLGQAIESAWDQQGLPTFRGYLRADLARRRASGAQFTGKRL